MSKEQDSSKDLKWFNNRLNTYLKAQDLKQTKQRKIVIEHLLDINSHVDAEMLHASIKSKHPNVGLATIYRTLNLLKSAELVKEQSFADGRAVFEINYPDTHHDHLVCLSCKKIVEFENETIEETQIEVAKENGFRLTSHRLDLYGYCEDCDK